MRLPDGWIDVGGGLAIKHGERPRLIHLTKRSAGPWEGFRIPQRIALYDLAKRFGADAFLCWWPPRSEPRWFPASDWPPPV